MDIENEKLTEFIHSNEFKNAIEKAIPSRVAIMNDYANDMKSYKQEFVEFMINGIGDGISKEDKKEYKKKFSKIFKKVVDYKHYKGGWPTEKTPAKLEVLADNIEVALKYFDFIGNDTFRNLLSKRGIFIDDKKSRTLQEDFNGIKSGSNENLKDIIDDADKCQTNICKTSDNIKNDVFQQDVPEELQYSKENPAGLKKSSFNKIVTTFAMKTKKNNEKMKEYINNVSENCIFNSIREKLIVESLME